MHHAAERGLVAHSLADGISDGHANSVTDELTDPVAFADLAAIVRSSECAVHECRVGARRRHPSLQIIGPR